MEQESTQSSHKVYFILEFQAARITTTVVEATEADIREFLKETKKHGYVDYSADGAMERHYPAHTLQSITVVRR